MAAVAIEEVAVAIMAAVWAMAAVETGTAAADPAVRRAAARRTAA